MRFAFWKREPEPEPAPLVVTPAPAGASISEADIPSLQAKGWDVFRDRETGALVKAVQMRGTFRVHGHPEKPIQEGRQGDYILKSADGYRNVWPSDRFESRFVPVGREV